MPILNFDDDKLKCCYDTLNINLGEVCSTNYEGKFTINIISFVNEDLTLKIEDYDEKKVDKEEEDDDDEKENKDKEEVNHLNAINFDEKNKQKIHLLYL